MKVIDLLNKIANNEIKQGTKFRINGIEYIYNNGYIAKNDKNKTMENFYISQRLLNDNVEILDEEDEFIDIEEFSISYSLDYIDYKNIDVLKNHLNKDFQTIFDTLDKLIKNQKKIINKLKEEGK